MSLAVVTLKKGEGRLLKSGGMWIFDNEVASIMGSFVNGDIVLVHDFDGYPLGRGFINTNSRIVVRLLSRDENTVIDEEFFEKRVRDAWEYRKKVTDTSSCRVIFGEADFLPGFIVDKFSDVLVVQSLALGIDRYKEMLVELLKKVLAEDGIRICGVYERSDVKVRKQEGMEPYKGFIGEEFPTLVEIVENGVKYQVDVKDGQKTGFFLDQKYNRLAIQKLCRNARVLDCFTHTGSFALNAGYAGAKEVTGVDASQLAVDQATANAALNGLSDSVKFICEDVFDLLPKLEGILEKVVSEGSGRNARIEGCTVGGKTATSQTLPRSANRYISSFLGFMPAEDPQILGLCIIHDPQGVYYGGTIAAPVIKNIFEAVLERV